MPIQLPQANDPLNIPDHALSHRVFANFDNSPEQSVTVDDSGNATVTGNLTASNLSGTNTGNNALNLTSLAMTIALG